MPGFHFICDRLLQINRYEHLAPGGLPGDGWLPWAFSKEMKVTSLLKHWRRKWQLVARKPTSGKITTNIELKTRRTPSLFLAVGKTQKFQIEFSLMGRQLFVSSFRSISRSWGGFQEMFWWCMQGLNGQVVSSIKGRKFHTENSVTKTAHSSFSRHATLHLLFY